MTASLALLCVEFSKNN